MASDGNALSWAALAACAMPLDMEVSAKPQEEKSIDWLDLEFWPESDFKVEAMQSNQTYDWVSHPVSTSDAQHMLSNHHQAAPRASAVSSEHSQRSAPGPLCAAQRGGVHAHH